MPGFKKIVIDDGDAWFMICTKCFTRFMTKGSKTNTWYGWFDCDYPPEARVKGSVWWRKKCQEGRQAIAAREAEEVIAEIDEILSQASKESTDPPTPLLSKHEMLDAKIKELEAYLKGPKPANKETAKKVQAATKELMNAKTELRSLKR